MKSLLIAVFVALIASSTNAQGLIPPTARWTPSVESSSGDRERAKTFRESNGVLGVRGDGTDSSFWRTPTVRLAPGGTYLLRFRARGKGGGSIISGMETVNRDLTIPTDWTTLSFAFRAPDTANDGFLRLGHWNTSGEITFADPELRPASVTHRRWGDLELGEGETLSDGEYRDVHTLGWDGSTIHRTLFKQNAYFNTNRWCIDGDHDVIYRHSLPYPMLSARISTSVGYYAGGTAVVSASTDGKSWTRVAEASSVSGIEKDLPQSLFPARMIYIRLHVEGQGAYSQFYSYAFRSKVDYHGEDRIGGTSVVEQLAGSPGVDVSWHPSDAGWNVRVANKRDSRIEAKMLVGQDGKWRAASGIDVRPRSAVERQVAIEGPSGKHTFGLKLVSGGETLYSGQTEVTRTVIDESDYGCLLDSGAAGLGAWWCEGAWKVGSYRPPPAKKSGNTIRIEAARGEYEPAQIVLRAAKSDVILNKMTPSDLVGKGGRIPASRISLMEVATVRVQNPTDYLGKAGDYPDPLPPLSTPMQFPTGRNQAIWVSVHVPEDTPPGDYQGDLTIETSSGAIKPKLAVHVFDFTLPKVSHLRSAFVMDHGQVKQYHKPETTEQERSIWESYLQSYADHRIAPNSFYVYDNIGIRFEGEGDDKRVVLDFAAFDKAVDRYMNRFGFNAFALGIEGMGGGTFYDRSEGEFGGCKADTPGYDRLFGDYLRQIENHLAAKGLLDKAYVYWFDEPDTKDFPFVVSGMDRLHRFAPRLKRLLTKGPYPELIGHVDLWVGLTPTWTPESVAERKKAGEEVWWYICCGPTAPYIGEFIEHPAVEMRLWPWQSWQYGVQGILVWDTTYWTSPTAFPDSLQNPWDDPASYISGYGTPAGTKTSWGNGDGRYLYPPRRDPNEPGPPSLDPPITSIRWENLRDGMEDYEYLYLLKQQVDQVRNIAPPAVVTEAERLLTVPTTISKNTTTFTHDPRPLLDHRRKVAKMIERLQKIR